MSNAVHEWPGTVLALNDLQRLGPNLRELIVADKVVLTPCARDEIKRLGVSLVRRETKKETSKHKRTHTYIHAHTKTNKQSIKYTH